MKLVDLKKIDLPEKSGIYLWKKGKDILYIGKATTLKDRVRSYFANDLIKSRGPHIVDMVLIADNIEYKTTNNALEALILEANYIKKYQPKYNTKEKDNKSFNYVIFTKATENDPLPKVLLIRGRNAEIEKQEKTLKISHKFGPFTSGNSLKEGLKILRKIFPFVDNQSSKKANNLFYQQIGLAPNLAKENFEKEYEENIKNLISFFQGKTKTIISRLEKNMKDFAKQELFEKANEVKKQIFALTHIKDISLIKNDFFDDYKIDDIFRIESYDLSHISGSSYVGVMTVVENGEVDKTSYRKFKIRSQTKSNDTGALKEVLERRFAHKEWKFPDLIVVDGGTAQLNTTKKVLESLNLDIAIVSVLKDEKHNPKSIEGDKVMAEKYKSQILLANSEAHRFAIGFFRKTQSKKSLLG